MSSETYSHNDRRRAKRRLFFWRIVSVILLLALIGTYMSYTAEEPDVDHVARLDINNVIIEDEWRQDTIQGILEDDTAKALIVYINSPGGSTYGSERLYKSLRRVAEKKPVISVIGTVGASGGYLTALAGERIFAGESSITGSIGVIIQITEFSELMDNIGIKGDAITSGKLKGEPSPFKPLSEAGRQNLQEMVSSTHEWFVNLVTDRRPLSREEAEKLANGGIYIGTKAISNGLIDELGGLYEARRWLESAHEIPADLPLLTWEYGPPKGLVDELLEGMLGKSVISERLTLDGLLSLWHPSFNIKN
ncbi:MAG: signal peptide peptidase SppA [Sneathiella sp.]|nr:signal peptide peptidase SppA [Sneathiella sp.]